MNRRLKCLGWIPFCAATVLFCARGITFADQVVAPTRGDTASTRPFGIWRIPAPSMRYQQVFSSGKFLAAAPQGMTITRITFAYVGQDYGSLQPGFQVSLSTTARLPDALSPIFSENIGSDDIVVFGPSSVQWPNSFQRPPFEYAINLSHPFTYLPASGNLLLDVRNFYSEGSCELAAICSPGFEALSPLGDGTSSLYANDVSALSGTTDTIGLVALFDYTAIPEPSAVQLAALMGLSLAGCAAIRGRRGKGRRGR